MRLILPLPLRRFLLGRLLFSVTIATAASGAEFVVDAAQATNPGQHVYNTLQELADSGALSSGDTVILHNDDSSLTSGLTVAVNFRSNDPDTSRTIDLAKLGGGDCLYRFNFNPFRPDSSGDPDMSGVLDVNGVGTLMLDSIILSNGRGLQMDEYALATKIIGDIQFKNSSGRAAIYAENVVYDVNASLRRAISLTWKITQFSPIMIVL